MKSGPDPDFILQTDGNYTIIIADNRIAIDGELV